MNSATAKDSDEEKQHKSTSELYNATLTWWLTILSDHFHQGYFDNIWHRQTAQEAQMLTILKLLEVGGYTDAESYESLKMRKLKDGSKMQILDIGCGVGGSVRTLAKKFSEMLESTDKVFVRGINISDGQLAMAEHLTLTEKCHSDIKEIVKFENRNGMKTGYNNNEFDMIWVVECAGHMPDIKLFLKECYRLLNNENGQLLMGVMCCKNEKDLNWLDKWVLKISNDTFNGSWTWISPEKYNEYLNELNYKDIKIVDWSYNTIYFILSFFKLIFFTKKGLNATVFNGNSYVWGTLLSFIFCYLGLALGSIKYAAISARK